MVIFVVLDDLSEPALLNLHLLVLFILLFLLRRFEALLLSLVHFVSYKSHYDEDEEKDQSCPRFPRFDYFLALGLKCVVEPEVSKDRGDAGDCEHSYIEHFFDNRFVFGSNGSDGSGRDHKQVEGG